MSNWAVWTDIDLSFKKDYNKINLKSEHVFNRNLEHISL